MSTIGEQLRAARLAGVGKHISSDSSVSAPSTNAPVSAPLPVPTPVAAVAVPKNKLTSFINNTKTVKAAPVEESAPATYSIIEPVAAPIPKETSTTSSTSLYSTSALRPTPKTAATPKTSTPSPAVSNNTQSVPSMESLSLADKSIVCIQSSTCSAPGCKCLFTRIELRDEGIPLDGMCTACKHPRNLHGGVDPALANVSTTMSSTLPTASTAPKPASVVAPKKVAPTPSPAPATKPAFMSVGLKSTGRNILMEDAVAAPEVEEAPYEPVYTPPVVHNPAPAPATSTGVNKLAAFASKRKSTTTQQVISEPEVVATPQYNEAPSPVQDPSPSKSKVSAFLSKTKPSSGISVSTAPPVSEPEYVPPAVTATNKSVSGGSRVSDFLSKGSAATSRASLPGPIPNDWQSEPSPPPEPTSAPKPAAGGSKVADFMAKTKRASMTAESTVVEPVAAPVIAKPVSITASKPAVKSVFTVPVAAPAPVIEPVAAAAPKASIGDELRRARLARQGQN